MAARRPQWTSIHGRQSLLVVVVGGGVVVHVLVVGGKEAAVHGRQSLHDPVSQVSLVAGSGEILCGGSLISKYIFKKFFKLQITWVSKPQAPCSDSGALFEG